MRICIINNLYPPHARGGAEQVVYRTVQGLLEAGHVVVVITTDPNGAHVWREGNLTIYRFRPRNLFFYTEAHKHLWPIRLLWHFFDMFHIGAARQVSDILKKEKPDVVHTQNLMGMSFLIPRVIRKLGIRHIHTVHDVQLVEPSGVILKQKENSWRYTGLPTRLYTWIMRGLMGSPDVVISPSQFLLDFYEKRGFFSESMRVVVRNPVTVAGKLEMGNEKWEMRNVDVGNPLRLLYLGQIEEHKGVLFLLQAFRKLMDHRAVLTVAGGGSLLTQGVTHDPHGVRSINDNELPSGRSLLRVEHLDNIRIIGKIDRADLAALFAETDVLIVPSLCYENSPTVIFEAFSFAVPVLASRVEGVAELIREGENGMTFETGNAEALIEKMRWCIDHRAELSIMSTKTAQSLAGLSQKDYIEKLEKLYQH